MEAGSKSYRFALLGNPVGHSLSPTMHEAAFETTGLEGTYELEECNEEGFRALVGQLKDRQWSGFNVTMPFKSLAESICDEKTDYAAAAGSVNSLKLSHDAIVGESTDARAFDELFSDPDFANKPLLVLGSGGSAAAALSVAKTPVFVSARNASQVALLTERFAHKDLTPVPFGEPAHGAVVVNATPIGMRGEVLARSHLDNAAGLIDLPYGPKRTPAVSFAIAHDVPVCDGMRFLSRQAAASFEWWTGVPVDPLVMEQAARNG